MYTLRLVIHITPEGKNFYKTLLTLTMSNTWLFFSLFYLILFLKCLHDLPLLISLPTNGLPTTYWKTDVCILQWLGRLYVCLAS